MSLADDFISSLREVQFTYKTARDWLVSVRFGRPVYQAQVYDLLINPLLQRGLIHRIGRGLYILVGQQSDKGEPSTSKDEFALYLKEKGVKP